MYKITWFDKDSGQQKTLKVHTLRAVTDVTETLKRQPWRNELVTFSRINRARIREIVIKVEA